MKAFPETGPIPERIAVDRDYDPITGMAPQSAIPIVVRPAPAR